MQRVPSQVALRDASVREVEQRSDHKQAMLQREIDSLNKQLGASNASVRGRGWLRSCVVHALRILVLTPWRSLQYKKLHQQHEKLARQGELDTEKLKDSEKRVMQSQQALEDVKQVTPTNSHVVSHQGISLLVCDPSMPFRPRRCS